MTEQPALRALTVSEILDRALRIYRAKFIILLAIVAVMLIPQGILKFVATLYLNDTRIVENISNLIFQNLATVALIAGISNANLGKVFTINSAYSEGVKRFWSVIGSNFIIGLAIALPAIVLGACLISARGGWLAIILVLPFAVFISTRWSLNTSAIVIENIGASNGLTRSWNLTKDFFWRVMGTSFAAGLLALLLTVLPSLFAYYILDLAGFSVQIINLIGVVIEQISLVIVLPFTIAVQVLIYYDLRIRKEGFDLMLRAGEVIENS